MPVVNRIAEFQAEMTEWRRDIHAHPELCFEEVRTSDLVASKLAEWGIEVHRGIAKTGLVGVLRGNGTGTRSIGLRADMDALPMPEANGFDYRSTVDGKMHACGHDGHTAMLLGAAKYLAETRNFDGTVHFIFQPAEEGGAGGKVMVDEGLFERFPCDAVYGMHNDPTRPLGTAAVVEGTVLAASDRFWIEVKGQGAHASRPHTSIDPVLIGAQIVVGLQSIVARRVDPLDSAVVSCTQFHAGSANNVIPEVAKLSGTVRTLLPATQDMVEELLPRIARSIAEAHGAEAEVTYWRGYPPTVNHAEQTERAALAAASVLGQQKIIRKAPPVMGGEDFSFMLLARPGCFVMMGQAGADKGSAPVHTVGYDFNDDLLPVGASFFAQLVEQELKRG
jgi:hippurate hydrolase